MKLPNKMLFGIDMILNDYCDRHGRYDKVMNIIFFIMVFIFPPLLIYGIYLPIFSMSCIVEGQIVSTPNGDKNIEDIRKGDKVWTINAHGEFETGDVI